MLPNLSTLDETADRFRRSPEFIWNLSLQFRDLVRPELGENGLIAYSDQQRLLIGRIIKLREQGMTDTEIAGSLDEPNSCAPAVHQEKAQCSNTDLCKKNFKILSGQVKFLWKQLCQLQSELDALKQMRFGEKEPAVDDRMPHTADNVTRLPGISKNSIS